MADQIKEWQQRAEKLTPLNLKVIEPHLAELDAHLTLRSHIVGYSLTDADTTVWKTIRDNRVAHAYVKQSLMVNLSRWFRYIEEAYPEQTTLAYRPAKKPAAADKKEDDAGNYDIGLQDVEHGVVTRFPPEPSYVRHKLLRERLLTYSFQWIPAHRPRKGRAAERLLRPQEVQGHSYPAFRRHQSDQGEAGVPGLHHRGPRSDGHQARQDHPHLRLLPGTVRLLRADDQGRKCIRR